MGEFERVTYKVKQEVPAEGIILHQMGRDVCGIVWGKGHQEIGSCYCQGATYWRKTAETGQMVICVFCCSFDKSVKCI